MKESCVHVGCARARTNSRKHVCHTNESCLYIRVESCLHINESRLNMNESCLHVGCAHNLTAPCLPYEWVMSTYIWVISPFEWIISACEVRARTHDKHVCHTNGSCLYIYMSTYKRATSQSCLHSNESWLHLNESCLHSNESCLYIYMSTHKRAPSTVSRA